MMEVFYLILIILLLFIGWTLFKAFSVKSKQPQSQPGTHPLDEAEAINRFSQALQIPTVSYENKADIDYSQFDRFLQLIQTNYPTVFKQLEVRYINTYGIIIKYQGANPAHKPVGFIAHYDVVPILANTEDLWTHPPFSGNVVDGVIWGRGTLDFKIGVISLLEALTVLLQEKYQPQRDVYVMFGFDEEISGLQGAKVMAETLQKEGIQFEFILDEGGAIVDKMVPGITTSTGVIGLSEKGMATVKLAIAGSGGHASQPKRYTNIGRIARAIARLEQQQFKAEFSGPCEAMFDYLAPHMPFGLRYIFANKKVFQSIIKKVLLKSPTTAALIRSTIAPTVFQAGEKDNVLPEKASALVNIRIIPGTSLEALKNDIIKIIDDPDIEVNIEYGNPATKVSKTDNVGFQAIMQAGRNVYPDTVFAPYIMLAASDARHYDLVSDNTYRFFPVHVSSDDLTHIHGTNESVSTDNYLRSIQFYIEAIIAGSKQ